MTQMISGNTRKARWMKIAAASLAFTFGLGVSAAALAQSMTAPQVQAKLTAQGYTKIHDLEFKDGMWHADAKSADGNDVDVRIDHARKHDPALAVDVVLVFLARLGLLVPGVDHPRDDACAVEQEAGELLRLAIGANGGAAHVVDQGVGIGGWSCGKKKSGEREALHAFLARRGRRRISAEVSSRPWPMACTST